MAKNTSYRIITNLVRIPIDFDVEELNRFLRTFNEEHHVFLSRHKIEQPWYSLVDVVHNICKISDLLKFFNNAFFKSQALPL